MRFLIGIITGAGLTLFIATAMDAPTRPALERAQALAESLWDGLIDRTSDSLFETTTDASAEDADVLLEALQQEKLATRTTAQEDDGKPTTFEPLPATLPATALAPPAEPTPPPPVRPKMTIGPPVPAAGATEPDSEPPVTPLPALDLPALAMAEANPASVWVPFHSQMSAEGFAARLSQALNHDFRVERRSAGAYQVVFDAADADERDALLAEIAEITGQ